MKKGLIFWMCAVLLLVVGMTGCDNDDNPVDHPVNVNLYGEWMLQGYGSDSNFTDAVHGHLILKEDSTFEGGIVNELFGTYTFNSNGEFTITECWGTMMYSVNHDYNFMEEQITECKIKSFRLLDKELRLYYSSDEYLKFLKNSAHGVRNDVFYKNRVTQQLSFLVFLCLYRP